jgi:hypothetical protein
LPGLVDKTPNFVLGLAIVGGAVGLASLALYFWLGVISPETAVSLTFVSLGASAAAVMIGFVLRHRVRLAHEGMFFGLATLGAWFLLFVYAFSRT